MNQSCGCPHLLVAPPGRFLAWALKSGSLVPQSTLDSGHGSPAIFPEDPKRSVKDKILLPVGSPVRLRQEVNTQIKQRLSFKKFFN
jgi:hypothetical protein